MTGDKSQLDKFKEAARELETDDDPERFNQRLKKLVKHKPVEETAGTPASDEPRRRD